MKAKELYELGENVFSKRSALLSLWQEQSENFYPERADFTFKRSLGTDFAANLMTSFPPLCRRELGDQIGSMLRPASKAWAHMTIRDQNIEDNEVMRFLEWATGVQRRAMYDPVTKFTRATKEGDHDYATFGQTVISVRLNRAQNALLYRCYHLRDMAWVENEEGNLSMIWRRWKPTARDLVRLFGDRVHPQVKSALTQNRPMEEFECMHMIVEADLYDQKAGAKPYFSIYYDCAHQHELEVLPVWSKEYVIPRWQTVSGSQYAFSPATVIGLPDARLLQAMAYTLLEAAEKTTNPPMVATHDVVRSDMAVYPGGVVWVDRDYDERLGEALRALNIDAKGLPFGVQMMKDSRDLLFRCFYLNKLKPFVPTEDPQMTAFQAGQIVAQYIRDALPLFEPMEAGYNGGISEETFGVLLRGGAFGPVQNMPRRVREALAAGALTFRFESPLHDAIEAQKGQKFLEMKQLLAAGLDLDKNVAAIPDALVAMREALKGIGVPATWIRPESQVKEMQAEEAEAQQAAAALAAAQQSADVVDTLASAGASAAKAEGVV